MNSHQSGLETWMLSLEVKSPLGPALFLCTHSSLMPWPLGYYRLLCGRSEPKNQCEGCNLYLVWMETRASWRSTSLQPSSGTEIQREPGLWPRPLAGHSDAGKTNMELMLSGGTLMHTTCQRTQICLLAHCLRDFWHAFFLCTQRTISCQSVFCPFLLPLSGGHWASSCLSVSSHRTQHRLWKWWHMWPCELLGGQGGTSARWPP